MQALQWFGAALQPSRRGKNQRAWVEWYGSRHTCRMLTYRRPESDHGWNAEGLYQVLLFATGACERAWIMKDMRTQFNTRISLGMVVPMLAIKSCFRGLRSCRKSQSLWSCHKDSLQ